jgi:hypothetical protein
MTLGALLALGVAAAWLAFAWALLTLFGYLDPPYVEWSILVVLPLAPWLAFRVQRVATEGPRDSTDSFRSPFLPEAPTQALLAQAMKPWDGAQWEELSRQLWKSKEVPAVLEGFRVVLEGGGVSRRLCHDGRQCHARRDAGEGGRERRVNRRRGHAGGAAAVLPPDRAQGAAAPPGAQAFSTSCTRAGVKGMCFKRLPVSR